MSDTPRTDQATDALPDDDEGYVYLPPESSLARRVLSAFMIR